MAEVVHLIHKQGQIKRPSPFSSLPNPKINNYSKIFYVLHLALLLEVVEVDPVVKTLQKEGFPKKKVSHLNSPKLLLTQEHMLKPTDVNLKVTKFILFQP